MRKILFSLLLATAVATPALAERPGHHDGWQSRDDSRADHSDARADRQAQRPDRSEARATPQERQRDDRQVQNFARSNGANGEAVAREQRAYGGGFAGNVNERGRPTLGDRDTSNDGVAQWGERQREQLAAEQVQDQRRQADRQRYDRRDDNRQRMEQQPQRYRGQQANDGRRSSQWDRNWRHDRRYNWRDYRNRHRSTFHVGIYYDPFGWGYQRYGIGYELRPNYYSSNYWLNDPSMYALPYAPFPFRWVRYYNDALLVNTYTGQVADVIYGFFW